MFLNLFVLPTDKTKSIRCFISKPNVGFTVKFVVSISNYSEMRNLEKMGPKIISARRQSSQPIMMVPFQVENAPKSYFNRHGYYSSYKRDLQYISIFVAS